MIHISTEELFRNIQAEHSCSLVEGAPAPATPASSKSTIASHSRDKNNNNNNNTCQEKSPEAAEAATNGGTSDNNLRRQSARRTSDASAPPSRRKSSPAFKAASPPAGGSSGGRARQTEDMSSILPAKYGNFCEPNNNTIANNNNNIVGSAAQINDDEVQAVLITGCGSKIGSNIAVAFAARGLKVALVDFNIKQTETVARECQEQSPKNREPLQIVADISQLAEAHKVIDRTIDAFGRLDVLVNTVNNASLMEAKFAGAGDDDPHVFEQYHKIIANNMHAVTYLCISAAPYLRKTRGSIVNVSSITNNETGSYKFAYCMSKAGISTLTKCLATDLAPDIKVICVSPKNDAANPAEADGSLSSSPLSSPRRDSA